MQLSRTTSPKAGSPPLLSPRVASLIGTAAAAPPSDAAASRPASLGPTPEPSEAHDSGSEAGRLTPSSPHPSEAVSVKSVTPTHSRPPSPHVSEHGGDLHFAQAAAARDSGPAAATPAAAAPPAAAATGIEHDAAAAALRSKSSAAAAHKSSADEIVSQAGAGPGTPPQGSSAAGPRSTLPLYSSASPASAASAASDAPARDYPLPTAAPVAVPYAQATTYQPKPVAALAPVSAAALVGAAPEHVEAPAPVAAAPAAAVPVHAPAAAAVAAAAPVVAAAVPGAAVPVAAAAMPADEEYVSWSNDEDAEEGQGFASPERAYGGPNSVGSVGAGGPGSVGKRWLTPVACETERFETDNEDEGSWLA